MFAAGIAAGRARKTGVFDLLRLHSGFLMRKYTKTLKPYGQNCDYPHSERERSPVIDDTEYLVEGCVAGDRRAQLKVFRKYREIVLNLVYRLLGTGHDVDDVTQQVFIRLFQSLSGFKGLSSLDTWVYRVTARVCTDQLRHKYRKRKVEMVTDGEEITATAKAPESYGPAHDYEKKQLHATISEALGKLNMEKRLVVVMFEIEGRSLDEIATTIGKPVGTVKSRLFHARKELKRHLHSQLRSDA